MALSAIDSFLLGLYTTGQAQQVVNLQFHHTLAIAAINSK